MFKAPEETLGVLGGMGPAATAEFLRLMTKMAPVQRDQDHPRIIILSDPAIPDRLEAFLGEGEDPTPRLRKGLDSLCDWGADVLAVPCNTAHIFIDLFRHELSRPLIHIVEATLKEAQRRSHRGSWLLATRGTCRSGLYRNWAERSGYPLYSVEEEVQVKISRVIRLVKANRMEEAVRVLEPVIRKLWGERALPVVLACTELPLAYDAGLFPQEKAVSSLEALAAACLSRFYGDPV